MTLRNTLQGHEVMLGKDSEGWVVMAQVDGEVTTLRRYSPIGDRECDLELTPEMLGTLVQLVAK